MEKSNKIIYNTSGTIDSVSVGFLSEPPKVSLYKRFINWVKYITRNKTKIEIAKLSHQIEALYNCTTEINKDVLNIKHELDISKKPGVLTFNIQNLTTTKISNVEMLDPNRYLDMKNKNLLSTKEYSIYYKHPNNDITLRDVYMSLALTKTNITKIRLLFDLKDIKVKGKNLVDTDVTCVVKNTDIFGNYAMRPYVIALDNSWPYNFMYDIDCKFVLSNKTSLIFNNLKPKQKIQVILFCD